MSQTRQRQPQQQADQTTTGWEGFSGLNTEASRYGIQDEQCNIMDGFFPIGPSNARVIPDNGDAIFSTSPSNPIMVAYGANIQHQPFIIAFLADGSIWAIQTVTLSAREIAGPGTIDGASQLSVGITQWGDQYIIIVANQPSGYWIWDGATFYGPNSVLPGPAGPGPIATISVVAGGSGYNLFDEGIVSGGISDGTYYVSNIETITDSTLFIGSITGTMLSVDQFVGGLPITVGMLLTPGPGAGGAITPGTAIVNGAGGSWTVNNSQTVATEGISGSTVGVVTGVAVLTPGTLYTDETLETITTTGSGTGLTVAVTADGATLFSGIQGTTAQTYQNRVWVLFGATVFFTAPGSVTDFSTTDGGGSFTSNDSFLRFSYLSAFQTNGYLYLIADSSISYLANPQTSGSPPTTTFSLQNLDPEVGSPFPNATDVFGSNIMLANIWGAHIASGGRAAKVSSELDGVYNSVPAGFGSFIPSSAKAIVFGKRVWVLLIPVIDQYTGQQVNKMFMWTGKVWCSTQQTANVQYILSLELASTLYPFGSDGVSIYPLFTTPTYNLTKVLRSKFWAAPGGIFTVKAVMRLSVVAIIYNAVNQPTVTVCIDSEQGSYCVGVPLSSPTLIWYTDNTAPPTPGAVVLPWVNNLGQPLIWVGNGTQYSVSRPTAVAMNGVIIGMTLTTDAADLAMVALAMIPVAVQQRI